MGLLAAEKFKPTLFVGLGGNGGKIVNLMAARLRRHAHWDRISSLTHFLVIDTNKDDLDKHRDVPLESRFLVSSFDARSYVDRKRGLRELPEDPLLTQWVPKSYQFRSAQAAGAGQIRLESRLRLYYNLEEDRAGIRRKIEQVLHESTRRENPWRDNEDKVVRVVMYGSVAGGTGSGGFLPMAYLLRQMIEDAGWGRPSLTAVLTLPTAFLEKVKPQLHPDILANGYAALKELEFIIRQLDYPGGMEQFELHYDPGNRNPERQFARERPFNLVYLVDRPDQVSIDKYENAIADACFLQIYSPLLGAQMGEYDNYEKHQKQLALGHFSVHYGAFGTALLQLPRRDLLHYASLRYIARTFREYLCFGAEEFRVPYGDPAFERLDPNEKAKRIDAAFKGYVAWRASEEERADEKGVFWGISNQVGKGGAALAAGFREKLSALYNRLDELIDIPDVERQSINPGNPSLARAQAVLRKAYADSRSKVRGEYLEAQLTDLRTGRLLGSFFKDLEVNPIAQRLFLIKLLEQPFITPFADAAEGEFLRSEVSKPDLDSQEVQQELSRLEAELARTASQGLIGKVVDSENKAFQSAKLRAVRRVDELSQDHREDLRRFFWKTFEGELRKVVEAQLGAFRKVSEIADELARQAESEAERFRKDPGATPGSDVAQYYLDAEVLRDDRRQERLWDRFYAHHLDKTAYFDTGKIFAVVTEAFSPSRDPDGTVKVRDANGIVRFVREHLEVQASVTYTRALEELGLDLATGLELEQRYIALLDDGQDFDALRRTTKLEDTLKAVAPERIRRGIEDRLKRLADDCVLLAHIDAARRDDPTVVPADVFFAGLDERFATDEPGSLGSILKSVVSRANFVTGWNERDSLVLYRALLGVPVYWFKNVQSVMQPAYQKVRSDPHRTYPLHIEARWEEADALPNLDPVEIRRADEKRAQEKSAAESRQSKAARIRSFTLCTVLGQIGRVDGGYAWKLGETQNKLGSDRGTSFAAFQALDSVLREDLEESAKKSFAEQAADRPQKAKLVIELRSHADRLKGEYAKSVAEQRDAERLFLQEERGVVEALITELEGAKPAGS